MSTALVFAFTAGAVSTVNPCGFALLPAWFARQFAGRQGDGPARRFLRAVAGGAAVTLGFVIVFSAAALVLASGANWLGPVLPYAGVTVGLVLVLIGLMRVFDLKLPTFAGLDRCRRANERYGAFGFGLSYGFISLSCSLPLFMAAVGVSYLSGADAAIISILAFLTGAGGVLALVSVAAAMVGTGVISAIGARHGILRKVAGALTALAGFYVFFYWGQTLFGETAWMRPILDTGGYWSSNFNMWLSSGASPALLLIGFGVTLVATYLVWISTRKRKSFAKE